MDSLTPTIPDFNDPLGMLLACHDRMRAQCETLQKLIPHLKQYGVDDDARLAIRKVVTYFNSSAMHHHQDEEEDIYPLLMRQSLEIADLVCELQAEHQSLNLAWETLKTLLAKPDLITDNPDSSSIIDNFCSLYRSHLTHEENDLLALAPQILTRQQLDDIGDSMAKRRGTSRQVN